ncbi:MAG: hypothetical protein WD939_01990 [Dehalococcoidia bacterium]
MTIWAITSYFNSAGYRQRLKNFRVFRERLAVPLIAVELAYGDRDFELCSDDADIVVQLRGGDVMWQKERLLNIALASLPDDATAVAWLDCDVVFERPDWPERAQALLAERVLVQPFQHSFRLPKGTLPDEFDRTTDRPRNSFACNYQRGVLTPDVLRAWNFEGDFPNDGYAWVGRRDVLERHGFYDACVVGGGTRDFAHAVVGAFDALIEGRPMTTGQAEHFLQWATPVYESVRARIGYIDGDVFHLWHGAKKVRRILERHGDLRDLGFDPYTDIALEEGGCWRWNSDKPALHAFVKAYFESRRDDG